MILNLGQAKIAAKVMLKPGPSIVCFDNGGVRVQVNADGSIEVLSKTERYSTLHEFKKAYGFESDNALDVQVNPI